MYVEKCSSDVKKIRNLRKQNFEGETNNMQLEKKIIDEAT